MGVPNGTIKSGDSFELASGQSIIIKDIPTGTEFKISENDYRGEGYKQTASGYKGTIEKDVLSEAEFTNFRGPESENPGKPGGGDEEDDGFILGEDDSKDPNKPVTKPGTDKDGNILGGGTSSVPKTGDNSMIPLWLSLMAASLIGIFLILRRRPEDVK